MSSKIRSGCTSCARQAGLAVGGREDLVVKRLQVLDDDLQVGDVVIDDQDRLSLHRLNHEP
jgi:hypothetical protein